MGRGGERWGGERKMREVFHVCAWCVCVCVCVGVYVDTSI